MQRAFKPTEIQLSSGNAYDYALASQHEMSLKDICAALSLISRFNGHTKKHYSVGQHSWLVGKMMDIDGRSTREILYGLLHDAGESAYCDIPQPLKAHMRNTGALDHYISLESSFMERLYSNIGIEFPSEETKSVVKSYDILALEFEMANCLDNTVFTHSMLDIEGKQMYDLDKKWNRYRPTLGKVFAHKSNDFAYSQDVNWSYVLLQEVKHYIEKDVKVNDKKGFDPLSEA